MRPSVPPEPKINACPSCIVNAPSLVKIPALSNVIGLVAAVQNLCCPSFLYCKWLVSIPKPYKFVPHEFILNLSNVSGNFNLLPFADIVPLHVRLPVNVPPDNGKNDDDSVNDKFPLLSISNCAVLNFQVIVFDVFNNGFEKVKLFCLVLKVVFFVFNDPSTQLFN
jgi:hypothetical protein